MIYGLAQAGIYFLTENLQIFYISAREGILKFESEKSTKYILNLNFICLLRKSEADIFKQKFFNVFLFLRI